MNVCRKRKKALKFNANRALYRIIYKMKRLSIQLAQLHRQVVIDNDRDKKKYPYLYSQVAQ